MDGGASYLLETDEGFTVWSIGCGTRLTVDVCEIHARESGCKDSSSIEGCEQGDSSHE